MTSVAEIKKTVKRKTHLHVTGLELKKSNPYWANDEQINYMEAEVNDMIEMNPGKISEKQASSLKNWINDLRVTYLFAA